MRCSKRYKCFILFLYKEFPEADYTETPEGLSCIKEMKEGLFVAFSFMIVHTHIKRPFNTLLYNLIENIELADPASTSTAKKTESLDDLPSVSSQQPVKDVLRQEGSKLSPPSTLNKPAGKS